MSILDRIVATKREEVASLRGREVALEAAAARAPAPRDFVDALTRGGTVGVIAEVKRRSPGAGDIRPDLDPVRLARRYQSGGASAASVLTDGPWFGGSLEDLGAVRAGTDLPVLRKDFVVDERQLLEARAAGADAVLLIVRILPDPLLRSLHRAAEALGLTPLVETHDADELERALAAGARLVGINNRDLDTFRTRLEVTLGLMDRVPGGVAVVSESGIRGGADVERLGRAGVDAVLVGEWLLRKDEPDVATAELAGKRRVARAHA